MPDYPTATDIDEERALWFSDKLSEARLFYGSNKQIIALIRALYEERDRMEKERDAWMKSAGMSGAALQGLLLDITGVSCHDGDTAEDIAADILSYIREIQKAFRESSDDAMAQVLAAEYGGPR